MAACPLCGGVIVEVKEPDGTISVECSRCTYPVCSVGMPDPDYDEDAEDD